MQDISIILNTIMQKEKCSPIRAFFILTKCGETTDELHSIQSKSSTKTSR